MKNSYRNRFLAHVSYALLSSESARRELKLVAREQGKIAPLVIVIRKQHIGALCAGTTNNSK